MASNGFSLADLGVAGMLDVVGFDPVVPQVIADFGAGFQRSPLGAAPGPAVGPRAPGRS
jgi:hypothetical protein